MTDKTNMAEPGEILNPAQKPLVPRDASTLVILDRSGHEPRILMGKRRADLAFMAGKYVFPGGRMDQTDKSIAVGNALRDAETAKLMQQMRGGKPSAIRAKALALAAVREAPEAWRTFVGRGFAPALAPLTFFARAITPPGRPRRFDTRFFTMDAAAISERLGHNDGELSGLDWLTLDEARQLDIPRITRLVLEDLTEQIVDGSLDAGTNPVPFYYSKNGSFKRDLITA
jgi:8-oxo-dGTP pyrophosphatase MutT (NUDIX family)